MWCDMYLTRVFSDWYADDWITKVYSPGRVRKVRSVLINHLTMFGSRYRPKSYKRHILDKRLTEDKQLLLK